jgi:PAS domain S-box-containing protein
MNYEKGLFEFNLNSIFITDIDGNILNCNLESENLLNIKKELIINHNITEFLYCKNDVFNDILLKIKQNSFIRKFSTSFKNTENDEIPVLINATISEDIDSKEINLILIIEDISEQKRNEEELKDTIESLKISREIAENYSNDVLMLIQQLEQSQQELKELNASKDKFFAIIAHDLKGPLSGINQLMEIVIADIENFSMEDMKEYFTIIHESITSTYKLLENLLHWARLQRGNMPFEPDTIDLNQLANSTIELLNPVAQQKNISLKTDIHGDISFFADYNMIYTVIRNLFSNSIKFTQVDGEITFYAHILDDDRILAGVMDNGIGMTQEDKDKLFKIGVHHTTLGTNKEKGTGLGLVLCKELIEKNGGNIWVESELGKGSTFNFTLKRFQ